MKYFTPELFIAFNSSDRTIARHASTQWDKAVAAYDKHLPPPVRQLRNDRKITSGYSIKAGPTTGTAV